MRALATVGTTKFDTLITEVLSPRTLNALKARGYTTLSVQCGNSDFIYAPSVAKGETATLILEGVSVELWKFKSSLYEEYDKAELIISHAGAGTIIEILRLPKPLIVVPNPTLLHNHQQELAQALEAQGYLKSSTIEDLARSIQQFTTDTVVPFPAFDGSKFKQLLDEEMGFI
ncbi:glycosyltransferase family 1 protein [Macrolepiota fuliginosa MF-IS2]|uniref:UDP-N-acetylglucosamine transferase subunit ALG13 n=1 Tax=Macrolepiota fuliginosa MF-IS2 TaxID=1400762 RepID=A0A9P5XJ06_9AGAR|nr:glycosyltransferase family 1 protein [Macrolepiota fuliginosa MF-IS2]